MSSHRHAETPLQFPSFLQAVRGFGRAARFRCPYCGKGRVLASLTRVRQRCASCNLRFERTDDNYWAGSMVFGFLLAGFTFGFSFLAILMATWPNPPWDLLQWLPLAMVPVLVLIIPASRILWLTVDVLVRPVVSEELVG